MVTNNLPLLWTDTCVVQTASTVTKTNGATGFSWTTLVSAEPCKISFYNNNKMNDVALAGLNSAKVFQLIKLFIRPDLVIPEGSKIVVTTHTGKTLYYKASGSAAQFTNHQEIILEGDTEWA